MINLLKDFRKARDLRPIQGVIFGALIGAPLWLALIVVVVAV